MPIYNKVCAIIVLFYPKTTHIKELIHNLSKNTDVILIDNTPNTINKELELYAKLNPNHILYSPLINTTCVLCMILNHGGVLSVCDKAWW